MLIKEKLVLKKRKYGYSIVQKASKNLQGLSCWLRRIQTPLVESKEQEGL